MENTLSCRPIPMIYIHAILLSITTFVSYCAIALAGVPGTFWELLLYSVMSGLSIYVFLAGYHIWSKARSCLTELSVKTLVRW